jgi:hypothetical protein
MVGIVLLEEWDQVRLVDVFHKVFGGLLFWRKKNQQALGFIEKVAQTMIDVRLILKVGCKHSGSYFSFF